MPFPLMSLFSLFYRTFFGLLLAFSFHSALAVTRSPPDYYADIQPIFDKYCVACHACFDAPCQLNLGSAEGLLRGASKSPVYNGTRMKAAEPTRLFIDAQTPAEWQQKGFFPVHLAQGDNAPVMTQMLDLKHAYPLEENQRVADELDLDIGRDSQCPTSAEMASFRRKHPHAGMPFAFPEIPEPARKQLLRWLDTGAAVTPKIVPIPEADRAKITSWEGFLNKPENGYRLLARWLYEHWSVARLYWPDSDTGQFYRLVRSRTPAGKAPEEIATRSPNMAVGDDFFYRFLPVNETRVYKTHIPFALNPTLLENIKKAFQPEKLQLDVLPGYSTDERANPFIVFSALSADARYRFMLDHAEYFIRTFIRGPVCRGQLATDVIRDHFWVLFQHPEHDPYISDEPYRKNVDALLNLPGLENDLLEGAASWFDAEKNRDNYAELRQKQLDKIEAKGPSFDSIWMGNSNAMLTVFRHHDSATINRGWVGQIPLTTWWMDFPLLERSYYNLVVNFDVFGALPHQLQTRLYFDLIRHGSEQNFLRLVPSNARKTLLNTWYKGSGKLKRWLSYTRMDMEHPSAIRYETDDPYTELLQTLLLNYADVNVSAKDLNRCEDSCQGVSKELQLLTQGTAKDMPAILHFPEASLLRLRNASGRTDVYTLIRNRYHSNVAFILGEALRYESEKDSFTLVPGISTGYPNFIFDVDTEELAEFVDVLSSKKTKRKKAFEDTVIKKWGIRRSSPEFWAVFRDIQHWMVEEDPDNAGILDLNRYVDYQ